MKKERTISLHPRLAAGLEGLVTLLFVWWLGAITNVPMLLVWFLARVGWWVFLLYSMYFPGFVKRLEHFEAVAVFNLGVVLLALFVDIPLLRHGLEVLLVGGSFASFWLVPLRTDDLTIMAKPYRRFKFLISIFGVAGSWVAVKALAIFQIFDHFSILALIAGAVLLTAAISVWGWREYSLTFSKKLVVASLMLAGAVGEMAYVLFLWPLGYFASGFVVTWVWYILWLLLRFYLTDEGVNWQKQRLFLLTNAILLGIFLALIVRWK